MWRPIWRPHAERAQQSVRGFLRRAAKWTHGQSRSYQLKRHGAEPLFSFFFFLCSHGAHVASHSAQVTRTAGQIIQTLDQSRSESDTTLEGVPNTESLAAALAESRQSEKALRAELDVRVRAAEAEVASARAEADQASEGAAAAARSLEAALKQKQEAEETAKRARCVSQAV